MNRVRICCVGLAAAASLGLSPAGAQEPQPPRYKNAQLSPDVRAQDLLGRLSLEEKFWQLWMMPGDLSDGREKYHNGIFGLQVRDGRPDTLTARRTQTPGEAARYMAEKINDIQRYFVTQTRFGIPMIPFEEALHGLFGDGSTSFPAAIGLAATFDTTMMGRVAGAIAEETRSRGLRQVLSPVINIASDVRWGRVEETYGEDPWLSSKMGVAFVTPFERSGVVTTLKHFIANVGEGGRDSYPIDIDERLLDELYLPPFENGIHLGGARSVMTSYNSVDGSPAGANKWLLTQKLKGEWGFKGVVISDAAAVGGANVLHFTSANNAGSTKAVIDAGLDVIFQTSYDQYPSFYRAFEQGQIAPAVIDSAVARVLRLKFELGLFEHPYVNADSAAMMSGTPAHRALAHDAAREAITLLKNDRSTLPLRKTVRSVSVIGADAVEMRQGGYSAPGNNKISILDGIKHKLGATAAVTYEPGPGRLTPEYAIVPDTYLVSAAAGARKIGLTGEYFDNPELSGTPKITRTDATVNFGWTLNSPGRGIPFDWYSVRWTGKIVAPRTGAVRIGVEGNDGYRLWVGEKLVIDNWEKRSYGSHLTAVPMVKGKEYDVKLEYFESAGNARVKLVWSYGVADDWKAKVAAAVAAVRKSETSIVVAGLEEGEFRDRSSLRLPGRQEELIRAVAATGKPLTVVIIGGSAVTMSWLDRVGAVVDAWYPGEEGGDAVADVLFGDYNPAGHLPITFPLNEGQLPLTYNHKPTGRGDDYLDGSGQPLFPFGFGLSYTTFEYSALRISPDTIGPDGSATVRARVKNSGTVAGDEVVQLYLRDVLASVARPVIELKGARRMHLDAGQEAEVEFHLSRDELSMLDVNLKRVVEPGAFRVMVGRSSKDIRLRGFLIVR